MCASPVISPPCNSAPHICVNIITKIITIIVLVQIESALHFLHAHNSARAKAAAAYYDLHMWVHRKN